MSKLKWTGDNLTINAPSEHRTYRVRLLGHSCFEASVYSPGLLVILGKYQTREAAKRRCGRHNKQREVSDAI